MRSRTNLDTSEANYLFSAIILKFNRNEELKDLPIPVKNKLIDEVAERCIEKVNNKEDAEALKFEITSYKLNEEEKKNFYNPEVYKIVEKPKGFNKYLKEKYSKVLDEEIARIINKVRNNN